MDVMLSLYSGLSAAGLQYAWMKAGFSESPEELVTGDVELRGTPLALVEFSCP